jgi:hypothetical protein
MNWFIWWLWKVVQHLGIPLSTCRLLYLTSISPHIRYNSKLFIFNTQEKTLRRHYLTHFSAHSNVMITKLLKFRVHYLQFGDDTVTVVSRSHLFGLKGNTEWWITHPFHSSLSSVRQCRCKFAPDIFQFPFNETVKSNYSPKIIQCKWIKQ